VLQGPSTGGQAVAVELTRSVLLREVNTRIRETSDRFGTPEGLYRLFCECGAVDCDTRLTVPAVEYDELRLASEFLVCAAHEPEIVPAVPVPLR
jgi:hypothetical protein